MAQLPEGGGPIPSSVLKQVKAFLTEQFVDYIGAAVLGGAPPSNYPSLVHHEEVTSLQQLQRYLQVLADTVWPVKPLRHARAQAYAAVQLVADAASVVARQEETHDCATAHEMCCWHKAAGQVGCAWWCG